ncbi:hypothetical protein [Algoriphagus boritolerans]|uniref:hypothetical protein n=1 Tax=Algoriphagus boritolerans TaxID=308111 RepID=UPI002FCE1EBA
MLGLGGIFRYAECLGCGSLQLDAVPEDLSVYYPSNYYSFIPLQPSNLLKRILKSLRMRLFLGLGLDAIAPRYGFWLKKT